MLNIDVSEDKKTAASDTMYCANISDFFPFLLTLNIYSGLS